MTPKDHSVDLCRSCSHAFIREGHDGSMAKLCDWSSRPIKVTTQILRCTKYSQKGGADYYELKEIAWTISTDPKGKLGFQSPTDRAKNDRRYDPFDS